MYATSDLYKTIFVNPLHYKETRIIIDGVEYTEADIVSASIPPSSLYEKFSIGNCVSREFEFEIFPKGDIPRQAQVIAEQRLVLGEECSEWIPQGVFFFATRQTDKETGALKVVAYDAMLEAEEDFIGADEDLGDWPRPQETAVADIAEKMGIEVDDRTVLTDEYPVDYPVDENGDLTMREILSSIAVSNAGNWVITNEGKLRLISAVDIAEETRHLVDDYGRAITLGGVRLLV